MWQVNRQLPEPTPYVSQTRRDLQAEQLARLNEIQRQFRQTSYSKLNAARTSLASK
jgi:hypothetical protein